MNDYPEDPVTRKAVDALHQWETDVDAAQRARLAAARRHALASTATARRAWASWGAAAAALLLLALGLRFWPQDPGTTETALLQALDTSQPGLVEAQEAELLLDEDLDFYLWLIGDAEAT